mmetsp:Transcript_27536/g.90285  ORF Transcript_27536/g.90285 Transcript_27536/m.90285 type:complete len:538 (-) Transcript_27536:344-1957(-)
MCVHTLRRLVVELGLDGVEGLLGVAEEHVGVFIVEDGVVAARVADRAHGALEHADIASLPHANNGHAGDGRAGVVLRVRVDGVARADDEDDVGLRQLVVDLLHLEHDVVRHSRLGEQHVELPRHAARHRVDGEAQVDALGAELLCDLRHRVLPVCDGETVPRHHDHLLGRLEVLDRRLDVGEGRLALEDHRLAAAGGRGAVPAQQHRHDVAVHRDAHDVRQDGAGRADERPHRGEDRLVEHEALRAERPPGVRVEHGDDDGHVGTADGGGHVQPEPSREHAHPGERNHAGGGMGVAHRHEQAHHRDGAGAGGHVDLVALFELQRGGGEVAVQLAEGDHRSRRRDASDDRRERDRREPHAVEHLRRVGGVLEVVGRRGEDGGEADERVEGGDGLRQRGRVDPLRDLVPREAAPAERGGELDVGRRGPRERADGRCDADRDARHAGDEAHAGGGLRGEAGDPADAAERRRGGGDGGGLREAEVDEAEAADEAGRRVGVQLVELGRVGRPLEHVEHLLGDEEAAGDVDGGDGGGGEAERL